MELRGSVGIVTGASRGIGVHIAEHLARRGVSVALAARDEAGLKATLARIERFGVKAIAVPTDVADRNALEELVRRTESELGPVDLLVNNAGVELVGYFERIDPKAIETAVEVNLLAPMLLSQLVVPGMIERGRGHILNVSSSAGKVARPFGVGYAATKHGLVGFSWSLRAELEPKGVGVSVICPGYVTGEGMFAEREPLAGPPPRSLKACTPDDVARAAIRAIVENKAEIIVAPVILKVADVVHAISVPLAMWLAKRGGGYAYAKKEATVELSDE